MKKGGYYFVEAMPKQNVAPAGTTEPDMWQPYKVWAGDLWECPTCGHRLVSGVGMMPLAETHHEHFADTMNRTGVAANLIVKDC